MVGLRVQLDVSALLTHANGDLDRIDSTVRSPRDIQFHHATCSAGMLAWFGSHSPSFWQPVSLVPLYADLP